MTFNEYYEKYLTLHTNVWCRRLHVLGQLVTIFVAWFIITTGGLAWLLIPILPFVVYPFAWTGHFVFEGNKPAAFKNPVWAKLADWRMLFDIVRGKQTL